MVMPAKNLQGERFGFLTVLYREGTSTGQTKKATWMCQCDCGNKVVRESQSLRSKHRLNAKSCGCKHGEAVSKGHDGHMMTGQRPWVIWQDLRRRCRDSKSKDYMNYGGRGIDMPDEWYHSFKAFWADMQKGYSDHLTLDRRDNDAHYSKNNCRWTTLKIQGRNTRVNVFVKTPWGTITVAEAAERSGIKYGTLYKRQTRGDSGHFLVRPV